MNDNKKKLFLFEALELRAELDARIKTFKDCLPEAKQNRGRLSFGMNEEGIRRPSPEFDVASASQSLRKLEFKRRKLNNAVQQANFNHHIEFEVDSINLNEALEVRKKHWLLEKKWNDEDQRNLHRLVEVRQFLWT